MPRAGGQSSRGHVFTPRDRREGEQTRAGSPWVNGVLQEVNEGQVDASYTLTPSPPPFPNGSIYPKIIDLDYIDMIMRNIIIIIITIIIKIIILLWL